MPLILQSYLLNALFTQIFCTIDYILSFYFTLNFDKCFRYTTWSLMLNGTRRAIESEIFIVINNSDFSNPSISYIGNKNDRN